MINLGGKEGKILFAPLVRVSTEAQERQGESLRVQKDHLTQAIETLGGEVYRWFEGQEHATPDYERGILEQLMADAQAGKFDAVIVADLSRWSRDNQKSKQYTAILKKAGIRFFEGTSELDLFNPAHNLVLGMGVEIQEFFSSQQSHKSILSRIARAKRGLPACGKLPYGRVYDKVAQTWRVDPTAQARVREIARLYLGKDQGWKDLGRQFAMNATNLRKILCERSGTEWEQRFISKRHGIDETIITQVPPLLPNEIIEAIRAKSGDRKTWDRARGPKNQYLFSRLVFDAGMGLSLTGVTNSKGVRYYRVHKPDFPSRYQINAKVLEQAVLEELYQALGSTRTLKEKIFDGHPLGQVAEQYQVDLETKRKEFTQVEAQLEGYVTAIGTTDDVVGFMGRVKPRIIELEARSKALKDQITSLEYQLGTLPTEGVIEEHRDKWAALLDVQKASYLSSGVAMEVLPFEQQIKIIRLFFGGKDAVGRRYGIYIRDMGGRPRQYQFEAYGKLGSVTGAVTAWKGEGWGYADPFKEDLEFAGEIGKVILEADPSILAGENGDLEKVNLGTSSERHAHHRQRVHQ